MILLPFLLLACTPTVQPPVETDAGETGRRETGSSPTGETGDSVPPETVPGDTGPEPIPLLCSLSLTCESEIPDDPKVPCTFQVVDGQGRVAYDGRAGVELRGRSSMYFPKHQYGVELWDAAGDPLDVSLLGMGAESDWIVNGAYIDRAFLRNKTGFDLFQGWGGPERYAAETAWCTLTLNGTWLGIYIFTEKVKRDDHRVVLEEDPTGTGQSFLLGLEESGGFIDHSAVGYGTWALEYPDPDTATAAQLQGVRDWVAGWQGALLGADPADPDTGIFAWVDLDSAVDFVILEEVLKNNDAYYLSIYLWRDAGGKAHFVPWDLDLTLGQPTYNNNADWAEWILYRPAFIDRMTEVPAFRERLVARWRELRSGSLSDPALLEAVDRAQLALGPDLYRNYEVWDWDQILWYWSTLPPLEDVDAEYARIREWIPARTAWIDAHIETY